MAAAKKATTREATTGKATMTGAEWAATVGVTKETATHSNSIWQQTKRDSGGAAVATNKLKISMSRQQREQAARACGQCVGAWGGDVMVEMTVGDWEGHRWLRKKCGSEMKSNCSCKECVRWVG